MWMQVWKAEAESFRRQVWVRKYRDSGAEEEGRAEDRCHQETVSQMEEKKNQQYEKTQKASWASWMLNYKTEKIKFTFWKKNLKT